jgi:hypothetical protein
MPPGLSRVAPTVDEPRHRARWPELTISSCRRLVARATNCTDWTDQTDEISDRRPGQRTRHYWPDGSRHLAKVRVAGSNPVVRSSRSERVSLRCQIALRDGLDRRPRPRPRHPLRWHALVDRSSTPRDCVLSHDDRGRERRKPRRQRQSSNGPTVCGHERRCEDARGLARTSP